MKLLVNGARRLACAGAIRSVVACAAVPHVVATAPVAQLPFRTAGWMSVRAFASAKTPVAPKLSAEGGDDDDSSEDEGDSDSDDEEEEEEEKVKDATPRARKNTRAAKAAAEEDDDWDEERWGALDSEDWQGFDGDIDAVTEEGVPTWLQSVRDLSAIHDEKRMRAKLARRAMEEAKKNVVRHRKVDEFGRAYGTGRRKTSTARVWVKKSATPFEGQISINKKTLADYFVRDTYREDVLKPFSAVNEMGNFDVYCTVKGGGLTGQAGAIRHGISRALQLFDPEYRPALKKAGYLTRDPRMVERKKPGQPKARKKFQWVKR